MKQIALVDTILLFALACSSGPTPHVFHDTGDAADAKPDIPRDKPETENDPGKADDEPSGPEDVGEADSANCVGCMGWTCKANDECLSGFCVEVDGGKVCSTSCSSDAQCPEGMMCEVVATSPSVVEICVHPFARLCRPCTKDEDCYMVYGPGSKKAACIEHGPDGRFCGSPCSDAKDCPSDYECLPAGVIGLQCRPAAGAACPCKDDFVKNSYKTVCYVENPFGKCLGIRTCDGPCSAHEPIEEACNQADDDCDGKTDEDVPETPCDLTNAYGTCKGKSLCVGGKVICDGPYAVPETCNGKDDDCNGQTDEGFPDMDEDGVADCVDKDLDGDGFANPEDNCPKIANPDQADMDKDGLGDPCDGDIDGDGKPNVVDNCPEAPNPDQANSDKDGMGDACDPDDDNDGVADQADNCAIVPNADQADVDKDGTGDECDCDIDGDGVANANPGCPPPPKADNCPNLPNPDQADGNGNGIGDACEWDWDSDSIGNDKDNCPLKFNPSQDDTDGDGLGDACDDDIDGDGMKNAGDNCPAVANPDQADMDKDWVGDACDPDMDGDGDPNATDCGPTDPKVGHTQPEQCNGSDDDCDEMVDEAGAKGCEDFAYDGDKDGWGTDQTMCLCAAEGAFTAKQGGDCDDKDPAVNPGATEICYNFKDDNCNGTENDEGGEGCKTYYLDWDSDNWGSSDSKCLCSPIGDYTTKATGDCDDKAPAVNPGAQEICNGADDDCSGLPDDGDPAIMCPPGKKCMGGKCV